MVHCAGAGGDGARWGRPLADVLGRPVGAGDAGWGDLRRGVARRFKYGARRCRSPHGARCRCRRRRTGLTLRRWTPATSSQASPTYAGASRLDALIRGTPWLQWSPSTASCRSSPSRREGLRLIHHQSDHQTARRHNAPAQGADVLPTSEGGQQRGVQGPVGALRLTFRRAR